MLNGGCKMSGLLLKLAIIATVGSLLSPNVALAQVLPPAEKTKRVRIIQGPEIESASDYLTIIRWTTNNPGGSDEHFGVVHYGTDPKNLSETAKSHIRLNRGHPDTVFRVRLEGLKPKTTYYYKVTSIESNGNSDGAESSLNRFTLPAPGERIAAHSAEPAPQPK
jgi:phosphodiesterase/alkaline phosphatase D-like protein